MPAKRTISRAKSKKLFRTKRVVTHAPIVKTTKFGNTKWVVSHAPIVEVSKKRKQHRRPQRDRVRAIFRQLFVNGVPPAESELSNPDLLRLFFAELKKQSLKTNLPDPHPRSVLREAGRSE
jgi:hypothetical protein